MNVINLIQGSLEWLEHRRKHFNASDAPAMFGVSPYKSRTELLHEYATGITPEHDAPTVARFSDGHRYEALARPFAEKILGEELYPVTGTSGKFSASFDGLTMTNAISYEHKTINNEIRDCFAQDPEVVVLPLLYRVQIEQQFMVSEAEKCLFMASRFDADGHLLEELHCWVLPDLELRQQIINGWAQFEKDLENYAPEVLPEKLTAAEVEAFPVPSIQVRGELVACNLSEIVPLFDKFLDETKTQLTTDQDFVDADANGKASREAAKNLRLTAKAVVDQIAPVSEAVRTLELYAGKFDTLGLTLEKAVKEQKDIMKATAILKAKNEWTEHVAGLEVEIAPIRMNLVCPDFATAVKGVKTIKSLHSNIADALAAGKIEADAKAKDIRSKLAWYREFAKDHITLFPDLQQIIFKGEDDFQLVCKSRIDEHKRAEQERLDREREKIRLEEEEKARVKAAAEAKEKAEAEQKPQEPIATTREFSTETPPMPDFSKGEPNIVFESPPCALGATRKTGGKPRPTDDEMIDVLALHYRVHESLALRWLLDMDLNAAGERMAKEIAGVPG
jgi:putative phage-type endonuclease